MHTCHAHGCTKSVPPRMFMCRAHWFSLPRATQASIWREYRAGQEDDKKPSLRYLAVQQRAVAEAAFRPNDEEAARISAGYLANAEKWRQKAIEAGEGDPFERLSPVQQGSAR